jgi:imidazolonepropionase-like amidohydrolase
MTYTHIYNATVIDGTGEEPRTDAHIYMRDGRIVSVGSLESMTIPVDASERITEIDAGGAYILPGLIDSHVHIMFEVDSTDNMLNTPFSYHFYKSVNYMRATLDAGITSIRDAGGADAGIKKAVNDGIVQGPRMQISVNALGITGGHTDGWHLNGDTVGLFSSHPGRPDGICDGVPEVRKKVREMFRAGADVIKVCSTGGVLSPTDHPEFTQFSIEELKVMVEEAHFRRGAKVMSHAQGSEGIKNAIRAGIHSIEHGIYLDDEAIELMLEHGTFLVPTLLAPIAVLEIGETSGKMPEYGIRKARETIEAHRESIARAYRAGVKIAMGTDAGVMPHGTNLRELGLMMDCGMSAMEAIVATTKMSAECLGWDDDLGTLEPGKIADLVMTPINPLENLRALEDTNNITLVIKDGQIVKDIR